MVKGDRNDFVHFNVCGNMVKKCANKSEVAACLTKDGVEHIIGTYIGLPTLEKLHSYFVYFFCLLPHRT